MFSSTRLSASAHKPLSPCLQVWCHAVDVSHVVVVAAVVVAAVVVVVVTQGIRTILSLETRGTSGSGRQHPELFFWGGSASTHQRALAVLSSCV